MLKYISRCMCTVLINRKIICSRDSPIYQYGFEITIATALIFLFILIVGALTDCSYSGLIYLLIISPLRVTAGGYHANTYKGCFVLSNLVFICTLVLTWLFTYLKIPKLIWVVILLSSCFYIVKNSPVRNPHHPVSESVLLKNKQILHIFLYIYVTIITILYATTDNIDYVNLFVTSVMSVAILIIPTKVKENIYVRYYFGKHSNYH